MAGENGNIGLSPDTKIVFSIKMFFSTIASILTIFVSFYLVAVAPKFDDTKEDIKEINERMDSMNDKMIEITNGIGVINGNIDGINNRFRDLNTIRDDHQDSGGSFGH